MQGGRQFEGYEGFDAKWLVDSAIGRKTQKLGTWNSKHRKVSHHRLVLVAYLALRRYAFAALAMENQPDMFHMSIVLTILPSSNQVIAVSATTAPV